MRLPAAPAQPPLLDKISRSIDPVSRAVNQSIVIDSPEIRGEMSADGRVRLYLTKLGRSRLGGVDSSDAPPQMARIASALGTGLSVVLVGSSSHFRLVMSVVMALVTDPPDVVNVDLRVNGTSVGTIALAGFDAELVTNHDVEVIAGSEVSLLCTSAVDSFTTKLFGIIYGIPIT